MAFKEAPRRDLTGNDRYPFEVWFNGEQWLLRRGVHYSDCNTRWFVGDLQRRAKALGLKLIITNRNGNIMLQARQSDGKPIRRESVRGEPVHDEPIQYEPIQYDPPDGPDDSAPAGIWY